jgi:hypothetical protein
MPFGQFETRHGPAASSNAKLISLQHHQIPSRPVGETRRFGLLDLEIVPVKKLFSG